LATAKGAGKQLSSQTIERRDLYPQGVASGDPTADSVIVWTRRPVVSGSMASKLTVQLSTDPDFKKIISGGTNKISAEADWTCRFLATGLKPNQVYWYRFIDEHGFASRVGRTVTAPGENSDTPVRFTFVSCQSPTESALNAYRRMIYEDEARPTHEQLNFVLHLGDFIYEVTGMPKIIRMGIAAGLSRICTSFQTVEKLATFTFPFHSKIIVRFTGPILRIPTFRMHGPVGRLYVYGITTNSPGLATKVSMSQGVVQ
jgi:alkaline phosphatase D